MIRLNDVKLFTIASTLETDQTNCGILLDGPEQNQLKFRNT